MATGALVEEVASNLEEVAQVTRAINTQVVSAFVGGTGFGAIVGAIFGYRFGRQRTKAEAMKEAQEEIDHMREHLAQKRAALRNDEAKAQVDEVLTMEGYVEERPGVFVPENGFERPLPPPVPVREPTVVRVEGEPPYELSNDRPLEGTTQTFPWNYNDEFSKRRAGTPYVIHEDEYHNDNLPMYNAVGYVYYGVDAVLTDEDDEPIQNVEEVVGNALNRFGHGSSDPNIVYVRNDLLQLQIEITRIGNSFEHERGGLNDAPEPA